MFGHGWDSDDFCYLTTKGRVSGDPHEIEIWFAAHGDALYLLAGDHASDWVLNLTHDDRITIRIRGVTADGTARVVTDPAEASLARRLVAGKYARHEDGLDEWSLTALPVAVTPDQP